MCIQQVIFYGAMHKGAEMEHWEEMEKMSEERKQEKVEESF